MAIDGSNSSAAGMRQGAGEIDRPLLPSLRLLIGTLTAIASISLLAVYLGLS